MKIKQILALGMVAVVAAGCVTQKRMTYMRDADAAKAEALNAAFTAKSHTVIRNGDALTIFVSALDQEAVTPYNLPTAIYATPGSRTVQTTPMLQYYIVDEKGDVTMPVLGAVHVAGLTRVEAQEAIRALLETQVVNPSVQVNL